VLDHGVHQCRVLLPDPVRDRHRSSSTLPY
jgi:hypothetical protein